MKLSYVDVSGSVTSIGSIVSVADVGIGALMFVVSAASLSGITISERRTFAFEKANGSVRNIEAEIATIAPHAAGQAITLVDVAAL